MQAVQATMITIIATIMNIAMPEWPNPNAVRFIPSSFGYGWDCF